MTTGAHATDAFDEGPGIARITTLEDHLQSAPHGAGRHGVTNHIVLVEIHLAAHVALDTGDRIDHDATTTVVQLITVGGLFYAHS